MEWVIQHNVYDEDGFTRLVDALKRNGQSSTLVKILPFVSGVQRLVSLDGRPLPAAGDAAIVFGTYNLAEVASELRWQPGAFLDNLDFEIQRQHLGDRMLNSDAMICAFADVPFQAKPFFIRPVEDSKAFTGYVSDWADYSRWRNEVLDAGAQGFVTATTPVMICSQKQVYAETRTWVVDGRVVTCSGYKVGTLKRYTSPDQVDGRYYEFATACTQQWAPNAAYVLDVADTAAGLKIVEINSLNSAGWYRGDVERIVSALSALSSR